MPVYEYERIVQEMTKLLLHTDLLKLHHGESMLPPLKERSQENKNESTQPVIY